MDSRVEEKGPVYCDTGRHAGQWRVDFTGCIYLSEEEFTRYSADGMRIALGTPMRPSCDKCLRNASQFWIRTVKGTEKKLCGECTLAHDNDYPRFISEGATDDQHS